MMQTKLDTEETAAEASVEVVDVKVIVMTVKIVTQKVAKKRTGEI